MIMRLITSLGVSLLLILGVGAGVHGGADAVDPGRSGATSTTISATSDATVHAEEAWGGSLAPVLVGVGQLGPVTGALLCMLGIICGIAATFLLFRARRRPSSADWMLSDLGRAVGDLSPRAVFRRTALSLAALGLSRT